MTRADRQNASAPGSCTGGGFVAAALAFLAGAALLNLLIPDAYGEAARAFIALFR